MYPNKDIENIRNHPRYAKERIRHLLRRYSLLEGEINELLLQLRAVKRQEAEIATDITSGIERLPMGKGDHSDPTFRAVDRMIEVYQKKAAALQRRIRQMTAERAQVDELLSYLSPREEEIIRLRYIRMQSWVGVARALFLCERQCQRIGERALGKMSAHLPDIGISQ